MNFEKAIVEFVSFSISTFKEATPLSSLVKLEKELEELKYELYVENINLSRAAKEYADCIMCLFDSAQRSGIEPFFLIEVLKLKIEENKKRQWIKNSDNTYSHIK